MADESNSINNYGVYVITKRLRSGRGEVKGGLRISPVFLLPIQVRYLLCLRRSGIISSQMLLLPRHHRPQGHCPQGHCPQQYHPQQYHPLHCYLQHHPLHCCLQHHRQPQHLQLKQHIFIVKRLKSCLVLHLLGILKKERKM